MQSVDAPILRGAALPTLAMGAVATVAGFLIADGKGALAGLLATAVVTAFFSVSALVVAWAAKISSQTMMLAAPASYFVKILVVMVLVTSMDKVTFVDTKVFGWAVVALALTWIVAEFRVAQMRGRPYVDDLDPSRESSGDRSP